MSRTTQRGLIWALGGNHEMTTAINHSEQSRWTLKNKVWLLLCGSLTFFLACLYLSSVWFEVRLDQQTESARYVFASKDGMLYFQWHDQAPGHTFPKPGAYWRVCRCRGHVHLFEPLSLLPRGSVARTRAFASFPIVAFLSILAFAGWRWFERPKN